MLILCEKPSVAQEFAKALNCGPGKGYYYNTDVIITYCVGHLFELCNPDHYDAKYKKWTLDDLPIIPPRFEYKKIDGVQEQANLVMTLLAKHTNDHIIIATDAGREGELIARIVINAAGIKNISKMRRFWVSEALTEKVIEEGITEAKPLEAYNMTARQGFARQHADWLVGINLTRFASIGNRVLFSVGRVQTAVLNAVATRNRMVSKFVPLPYYELEAKIKSEKGSEIKAWLINPETKKTAFMNKEGYLQTALEFCKIKRRLNITSNTVKRVIKPPKLLNITGLEKTAYKKYGYSPEETDKAAQALYEKHKCLSYPRTPSRVMGESNVELFLKYFHLLKANYSKWSTYSNETLIAVTNRHIFNNAELEDHHGLIPVGVLPEAVSQVEKNVFNIVVQSFFTVCMPDCVYNEKQMDIRTGEYLFQTKIKEILEEGWKKSLLPEEHEKDDKEQEVKNFDEKNCYINKIEILNKKTNPPKEFSIDTLLSFMENPKDDVGGGKLAGLGTPATRGDIIKTLFERGYFEEKNKKLLVTKKGIFLLEQLKKDTELGKIADVRQSTDWEQQLNDNPEAFEQTIKEFLKTVIKRELKETFQPESPGFCPHCKKPVYEGKKTFYCSGYSKDDGCKFSIGKEIAGAKIAITDVGNLLEGKPTAAKNFISKTGKKFSASLKMDNQGKIEFIFKDKKNLRKTKKKV
jgi:DNA topoisomerase-3